MSAASAAHDRVLSRRLAVQRLTSAPLPDPVDVVRLLTCVQAQDAPLARFSVGMRTAGATDTAVRAAIDAGAIVRTHILRPTWHFVAAEDLRWILDLTSAKVETSMAARHRVLGLDAATVARAFAELAVILADRRFPIRAEIGAAFAAAGLPHRGEQVAHLLLCAELRGLICSGPLRGPHHTYALVDEWVAPTPRRDRDDAARQLVWRFFAGHGPAAITDLTRWTTLTKTEVRAALADLSDRLETSEVDGTALWSDPRPAPRHTRPARRAFLLPTFDEVFLTYPQLNFPRAPGHPRGDSPHSFAEAGGGLVICDRRDVGWWKRTESAGRDHVTVTLTLAGDLDAERRALVHGAAERLAAFTGRQLHLAGG